MTDRKIVNDLDLQGAQKVVNALDGTDPQDYVTVAQLPAGGGTISDLTSFDGTINITDPTGPTSDLSVVAIEAGTSADPIPVIIVRHDSAANWTSNNPTLNDGEFGWEDDTLKLKCGDGATAWISLAYIGGGATPNLAAVLAAGASAGAAITNLTNPSSAQDAATKFYVDAVAQGLSIKASCRLATAAALPAVTLVGSTLVAVGVGVLTVDGQAVALNDRVLVKDQVAGAQNGIYTCTTAGAVGVAFILTRATDSDTSAEIVGGFTFIEEGTVNAAAGFVNTNSGTITVGTTPITYTQFSGAGEIIAGAALTKTGNTLDVAVDGSTIVVTTDALNVKAGGIDTTQLANAGPGATGPIGSATIAPIVTIDAKGRVTALSSATISSPGGLAVYGDGSDATVTFDGTTTILGIVPNPNSASVGVYTLVRDIFLAAGTLNSGISIITNGFRIFCAGTFTNNGTIKWNGGDASGANGSVAGAAVANNLSSINRAAAGTTSASTVGATGVTGVGANGTGGGGAIQIGGIGGAGGAGSSGAGGSGGTAATASDTTYVTQHTLLGLLRGGGDRALTGLNTGGSAWVGGSGGGSGAGDGTNKGGGGGGGGGLVLIFAKTFAGTGAIQARGGNGGTVTTSTLGAGGGGGGGGGLVGIVSSSVVSGAISGQTIDANGGTKGTKLGTAGVNGSDGNGGSVVLIPN